ncbi:MULTISPECIES: endonuclease III [Megasphaera]|uniref:Endonuclease III n=1 Tax=Megasphaera vaginalis (ex Srinivasan et al. 2021) TaxID=1111454 RepID=U7UM93_9FIRM|nr:MULTISPECIES: endonuclease III [Megasphaera]ERT60411.1 endonuclease III [Megasphaera vaginalis (ex Srinivasan et al. 2021)]
MVMTKKKKMEMLQRFQAEYGIMKPALHYGTPFELLVAVVLSAQCTDERVNIVTAGLFPEYNTPQKMLSLGVLGLEEKIRTCGLYRSKAKNLMATCAILCETYHGEVPRDFDSLVTLPGVGRKTANVLISVLFDIPAIAVDTHVFRVANRMQLAVGKTPLEVEMGLQKAIPKEWWSRAHHWLIWHGRRICKARTPLCEECFQSDLCPGKEKR